MLMVPGWIDHDMFVTAIEQAGAKNVPARLEDIRVETLSEGRCVQTLHVGSFDDEAEVLAHFAQRLHPAQRVYHGGQASRDLPQRLPQSRTREAANHPETTDRRGRRVDARRTSPCLLVMCSPADAQRLILDRRHEDDPGPYRLEDGGLGRHDGEPPVLDRVAPSLRRTSAALIAVERLNRVPPPAADARALDAAMRVQPGGNRLARRGRRLRVRRFLFRRGSNSGGASRDERHHHNEPQKPTDRHSAPPPSRRRCVRPLTTVPRMLSKTVGSCRSAYGRVVATWEDAAPGVLTLPSGRRVRGRGLRHGTAPGPEPEFALYLLARKPPSTPWPSWWLRWPHFGLPADRMAADGALREVWERCRAERVEVTLRRRTRPHRNSTGPARGPRRDPGGPGGRLRTTALRRPCCRDAVAAPLCPPTRTGDGVDAEPDHTGPGATVSAMVEP